MKKILSVFAIAILTMTLSACSSNIETAPFSTQTEDAAVLDDYSYDEPFFSYTGTGDDVV